jgi:CubicO group peptidase (beta-lactamase class C family)
MLPTVTVLVSICSGCATADGPPTNKPVAPITAQNPGPKLENLKPWLQSVRARSGVPALAVAVVSGGDITFAATGRRKADDPTAVTDDDAFHLGSCTKSMTATLLAFLVEDGKLKWDSTLADIFPELKQEMRPELRGVTVRQLLNQRSGLASETWPEGTAETWLASKEPLPTQRACLVKAYLAEAPTVKPGTDFIYSNRNYIVAGAIAERITGKSWETLIRERLFKPLYMKSADFGPTATSDKLDGVWAHLPTGEQKRTPLSGPHSDNPPVLGPAGTVHCSMEDWAKYIRFVMKGSRGEGEHLSKDSFAALTTPPPGSDYAFGWISLERGWGKGKVLTHSGSNTVNYCVVWMAPARNFAVLVATNTGDGAKVCDEVASALILELDKKEKGRNL